MSTGIHLQSSTLSLSDVKISLASDSHKTIKSIKIFLNDKLLKKASKSLRAGDSYLEEFYPPLPLELSDCIRTSVKFSSVQKAIDVDIDLRDKPYEKEIRGITVSLSTRSVRGATPQPGPSAQGASGIHHPSSPLSSDVFRTIQDCPRFRLLVIGNTGVGKSTLIQNVFGVQDVHVSENTRGKADIDKEFVSSTNDRFVVHDSLGFEAGDERHMSIMKNFVARRQNMPAIKDQLHAVWLCLEIPYAGGRLIETGVEELLKHRRSILGDIPLVVVLTKVDLLDGYLEVNLRRNETLDSCRPAFMEEHCITPLQIAAGPGVTHIAVSIEDDYTDTLLELLKATMQNMANCSKGPYALVAIAQRISIQRKNDLSIEIGRKKYWKTLVKSALFRGRTLKECLRVIQGDIVAIWNLNDPDQCLMDDQFINTLLCIDNSSEGASTPPMNNRNSSTDSNGSISQKLMGFLNASSEMKMVPRFMANLALAAPRKLYDVYTGAQGDVKTLMAYIVNLNCIMQFIFLFSSGDRVTPQTITHALHAYMEPMKSVHATIQVTDVAQRGVNPGGRDSVLEKIVELINHYSIKDHEIRQLKQRIQTAQQDDMIVCTD